MFFDDVIVFTFLLNLGVGGGGGGGGCLRVGVWSLLPWKFY